jgi:hypothetical protein
MLIQYAMCILRDVCYSDSFRFLSMIEQNSHSMVFNLKISLIYCTILSLKTNNLYLLRFQIFFRLVFKSTAPRKQS